MNILQRKCIDRAFLCIKTDRDSLYISQIIHGTFLFKIRKCNMMVFLVKFHRRDRRWNLLYKCQLFSAVLFIGHIQGFLQHRTSKSSGIP